jgi:hypothetical protein
MEDRSKSSQINNEDNFVMLITVVNAYYSADDEWDYSVLGSGGPGWQVSRQ